MRKDWFDIKGLIVMVLLLCNAMTVCAQGHSLEIKGGVIATSTRNTGCKSKTVGDYKLGITAGGSFSWNFMDESLRAVAECYYALQGERYTMDDNKTEVNTDLSYFKLAPNIRYYAPYVPVYCGMGFYTGFATIRHVYSGDKPRQARAPEPKPYYKGADFGSRMALGISFDISEIQCVAELAYEYGFANISNRKERKIRNQSLCFSLGVCFPVTGKHYRHF
jgi:hypothetical protein